MTIKNNSLSVRWLFSLQIQKRLYNFKILKTLTTKIIKHIYTLTNDDWQITHEYETAIETRL